MSPMALFDHLRVAGLLSSSREVRTGQESNFAIVNFFHVEWVFLRKIHFCIHPFQPKNAISRAIKEEH